MFRSLAKIDFLGVPHRGGAESITSLLGQQVDFLFESPVVLLPLIARRQAARARRDQRDTQVEADVPTMVEAGVAGFVATLLTGIVAPAGTPAAIVSKLNGVINETLKAPDVPRPADEIRLGAAHRHAAGVRSVPRGRDPQMVGHREGRQRVDRVIAAAAICELSCAGLTRASIE